MAARWFVLFYYDRELHSLSAAARSIYSLSKFKELPGGKALQLVHEVESGGSKALAMKAGSSSAEELRSAVANTAEIFGPLDIFVSKAGISY